MAKIKQSAGAGAVPPPNAPKEVSQPLTARAGAIAPAVNPRTGESFATEPWHTMDPLARARHNEKELAPLTFGGQPPAEGSHAESVEAAREGKIDPFYKRLAEQAAQPAAPAGTTIRRIKRAGATAPRPPVLDTVGVEVPPPTGEDMAAGIEGVPELVALQPAPDPDPIDLARMPAASDTDSPARGVPRGTPTRPGKEITGGFSSPAEMQYFALDGRELKALVETLMDELHARIQDDLRFNEALVYPRVAVKVAVTVTGYMQDNGFLVERVLPPTAPAASATPLDIAEQVADEVVFVMMATRRETDDQGESVTPPDAIRVELGLDRPYKRRVVGPTGQARFVDVE